MARYRTARLARLLPGAAIVLLGPVWLGGAVLAHKNGIAALGCDGCHNGGKTPAIGLLASAANPAVGQAVTLTITVPQLNGPAAGFYLTTARPAGTFTVLEAGTAATVGGVTHTMPRIGSGGSTTFKVGWSTAVPTAVQFIAYALSANNDGTSRGDAGGGTTLAMVAGCAGTSYFLDQDGDGYGTADPAYPPVLDCTRPSGYAVVGGDCDNLAAGVHPGAAELCNGKDDNCDGNVDENVVSRLYCEDKDGDGHGVVGAATKMDCAPSPGFGDCGGDCNDRDPTIHAGATEVCNGQDDTG